MGEGVSCLTTFVEDCSFAKRDRISSFIPWSNFIKSFFTVRSWTLLNFLSPIVFRLTKEIFVGHSSAYNCSNLTASSWIRSLFLILMPLNKHAHFLILYPIFSGTEGEANDATGSPSVVTREKPPNSYVAPTTWSKNSGFMNDLNGKSVFPISSKLNQHSCQQTHSLSYNY